MQKIYKPKLVYTNDKFMRDYAVVTEDSKIIAVEGSEGIELKYPEAEIEKGWDRLILVSGTVNIHNHCFQSLLRGLSCDRPFLEWRDKALYNYSPKLTKEHIYGGAVFAFGEMMKYGVTTVSDFFYLHNFGVESDEMIVKAAKDVGIRLVLARTMYDWDGAPDGYIETIDQAVENTRYLANKYKDDPMVTVIPAPHSLHAASPEMIKAGHDLAMELGTKFHIHVAEEPFEVEDVKKNHDGLGTIEFLDKMGVVDDRMVIIHGVWLSGGEIDILGKKGGSLAYCPSSNMFLADGITDIPHMMRAGVKIGLGSDGACSNNRISVYEEMRMVAMLQKAATCDAMCVNYKDAYDMGTKDGAEILDLPVGQIKVGLEADFNGIDFDAISMQPISESLEQVLPNIVYSMQPEAIKKVVVAGKTTVEDGKLVTVPEEKIVENVRRIMAEVEAI